MPRGGRYVFVSRLSITIIIFKKPGTIIHSIIG